MSEHPGRAERPRSPAASMTLLSEVMERPLDPSYVEAAQHRGRHYRQSGYERTFLLIVAILAGIAVTAAVMWLRAPQPASIQARELLGSEITDLRATVAQLRAGNEDLRQRIDEQQETVLGPAEPSLEATRKVDALVAGQTAVTGPGLVVTLRDGQDVAEDDEARVQDSDVQSVVNALWAGGAEAVAVNGNRLGPMSAIRSAGAAILVDLVGLASPYKIEAVGDSQQLGSSFARSSAADRLAILQVSYGIRSDVAGASALTLGAAPARALLVAHAHASVTSDLQSDSVDELMSSPKSKRTHKKLKKTNKTNTKSRTNDKKGIL